MNSLFRKLRAEMFSNNKVGRYLTYAAGEVLLIVIGILIAVELSNLNDQRRASDLERAYLERIAGTMLLRSHSGSRRKGLFDHSRGHQT